jgi:hypothetical protein
MINNEQALAFVDTEHGTLKESYFSPYVMLTVPHTPSGYKNIPIPPGIRNNVIELFKEKIAAGVYEPSQSSYGFVYLKKMLSSGPKQMIISSKLAANADVAGC